MGTEADKNREKYLAMLKTAVEEARLGLAEGGIPIGAVLFERNGRLLGRGRNRRVQEGDPSAHGETDAFRKAGRHRSYRDKIMVTTLAPCWYCSGLIRQFGIGTVVVGESVNFRGGIDWLRENGTEVIDLHSEECVRMLGKYVTDHPEIWNEDIGVDRRLSVTPAEKWMDGEFLEMFNIAAHFLDAPAALHPHRPAIVGEPREASYGELAALANRAGNALRAQGVSRGDRVLIALPDTAEFIAAFFGTAKIGAVAVPVNPFARSSDYIHYLENSEPQASIIHSNALAEFLPASSVRPQVPIVVVGDEKINLHSVSFANWSAWIAAASDQLSAADTSPGDSAFLLYTSGSGGAPKAAVHRHADMLVTSRNYARDVLGLRADDLTFSVSKLFFAYGLGNGMYFPLSVGARTLLNPERTSVAQVIDLVARRRPTIFFAVPTFYAAVLREAERPGHRVDFSSVRMCVSAGEALPAEIFNWWKRQFGLEILDGIGSTEMLHMFISSIPGKCKPGSCGFPVPGYEAKIVDDNEESVGDGETGNLWVRGASAFAEYWRIPELTARTKRGDWIVTGDKFFRDSDGYYHYCGRADDMLKVAGMWVSPMEVENALLGHPHVAEAAVVGATDDRGLAYSVAHIVLRGNVQGSDKLAAEICEHVRARLVSYKVPREVRFSSELPKTVTGKIQRFKLRGA